jgi:hypothetical protein
LRPSVRIVIWKKSCSIAPPSAPTSTPPALKKNGPQALGRVRGGFGTKIHGIVDALGNPIGFTLIGAEQADITQARALLDKAAQADAVIADKGHDSDSSLSIACTANISKIANVYG